MLLGCQFSDLTTTTKPKKLVEQFSTTGKQQGGWRKQQTKGSMMQCFDSSDKV